MNDIKDELKFYKFGEEQKKVEKFNKAFKSVIEKDIDLLESRIVRINNDITKRIVKLDPNYSNNKEYKAANIDELIRDTEQLISNYIIEKGNIKVGMFSSNKKEKKHRILELEKLIEYLSKCQNDFISMKNEYNKLKIRKLKERDITDISKEIVEEEDPLERTINFYMKKQEKNN